jgi:hypothetical protein
MFGGAPSLRMQHYCSQPRPLGYPSRKKRAQNLHRDDALADIPAPEVLIDTLTPMVHDDARTVYLYRRGSEPHFAVAQGGCVGRGLVCDVSRLRDRVRRCSEPQAVEGCEAAALLARIAEYRLFFFFSPDLPPVALRRKYDGRRRGLRK